MRAVEPVKRTRELYLEDTPTQDEVARAMAEEAVLLRHDYPGVVINGQTGHWYDASTYVVRTVFQVPTR